jgi:hypothetical protein
VSYWFRWHIYARWIYFFIELQIKGFSDKWDWVRVCKVDRKLLLKRTLIKFRVSVFDYFGGQFEVSRLGAVQFAADLFLTMSWLKSFVTILSVHISQFYNPKTSIKFPRTKSSKIIFSIHLTLSNKNNISENLYRKEPSWLKFWSFCSFNVINILQCK